MFAICSEYAHALQLFFWLRLQWISTILGWSWCWALGSFLMGEDEDHLHAVWTCFRIKFLISLTDDLNFIAGGFKVEGECHKTYIE